MDKIDSIEWNCVEWSTKHHVKRFKVLNVTTSDSTTDFDAKLKLMDDGIEYEGRLLATNKTDTLFGLFTNIMSYNDIRMFLTSNRTFFFLTRGTQNFDPFRP